MILGEKEMNNHGKPKVTLADHKEERSFSESSIQTLKAQLNETFQADDAEVLALNEDKESVAKHTTYKFSQKEPAQFYTMSNDDFLTLLDDLQKSPSQKQNNALNVALLVGTSHIPSSLPELVLHADAICIADIDPRIFNQVAFMIKCIKEANSRDDFMKLYLTNDNPYVPKKRGLGAAGKKTS